MKLEALGFWFLVGLFQACLGLEYHFIAYSQLFVNIQGL
jgi:hypothetical protein